MLEFKVTNGAAYNCPLSSGSTRQTVYGVRQTMKARTTQNMFLVIVISRCRMEFVAALSEACWVLNLIKFRLMACLV